METLISLLIVIAVVAGLIWLVKQIQFPAGLEIVQTIMIAIVVIAGIIRLWPLIG